MKAPVATITCALVALAAVAGCKPALNQANADKLIPNGMTEAAVAEIVGTNGVVSFGQHGVKLVMYFFPFTGMPPKVETKLVAMTVVFSNAVVIERRFPSTR